MKKFQIFMMAVSLAVFSVSCTGDDGAEGPAGPAGATGPQGVQGVPGNNDAKMYTYGSKTFTSAAGYVIPNITPTQVQNSFIYAFYSNNGISWFPAPGIGDGASFEVRTYLSPGTEDCSFMVGLYTFSGGSYANQVTWAGFRIIVMPIPSGNITALSREQPVNPDNYDEVMEYYGFPK